MQMKDRGTSLVAWLIGIGVLVCLAVVFPRAHRVLGPRFFCSSTEIDVNSGSLRRTRFIFFVPIYRHYQQTALAKEVEKAGLPKLAPLWVEAVLKAGIDDYYPRPVGGKLLSTVNQVSSILEVRPELVQTNSAFILDVAKALQQCDYHAIDTRLRLLIEECKSQ